MKIKVIFLTFIFLVFVSGCEITGKVVEDISDIDYKGLTEKDADHYKEALKEKSADMCNYIQKQEAREDCFIDMAEFLQDKKICDNLLAVKKQECLKKIN